jgi:hypothetical protein
MFILISVGIAVRRARGGACCTDCWMYNLVVAQLFRAVARAVLLGNITNNGISNPFKHKNHDENAGLPSISSRKI